MERDKEMTRYVLDTSVVVKWFSEYDENDLEAAINLRNQILEKRSTAIIPDLLIYEIANALRYNPNFTENDIKKAVNTIFEMDFEIRQTEKAVMDSAIEIAVKKSVSVYDAYFLAISKLGGIPLVTADYRFAKKAKGLQNIIGLSSLTS